MAKKRPTLDAFLNLQSDSEASDKSLESSHISGAKKTGTAEISKEADSPLSKTSKPEIIRHMLYLPLPVYDQLQSLIFEEQRGQTKRRKTHDYLLDAIDLLFKEKGLKSIADLTGKRS